MSSVTKDRILNEIGRTTEANGGVPLGAEQFSKETGIKSSDWYGRYWARWGDALREAGFKPNQMQAAYGDEILIDWFVDLTRKLGHLPVRAELEMNSRQRP